MNRMSKSDKSNMENNIENNMENNMEEKLLEAIGYIDSDIIDSAADALSGKKKYKIPSVIVWKRVVAIAAIVAVMATMIVVPIMNLELPLWPSDDTPEKPNESEKDPWYDNLEEDPRPEQPENKPSDGDDGSRPKPDDPEDPGKTEKCPDCGMPTDECECENTEANPYSAFVCPLSSSTVYGKVTETNALSFNDVWGSWEVVSEGEEAGAVHALDNGACIAVINNVDFKNAKKVTISADFMLPSRKQGNNNYGFILDLWVDKNEDTFFYWESNFNSYYYALQSGGGDTGTLIGKWGASTVLGSESNGWTSFNDSHGVESPKVDGISFEYGKYTNIKCIWDIENDALELYYDGQLTKKVDFNENTFKFTNEGDNGIGLRANRGDVYFKNIDLVVE